MKYWKLPKRGSRFFILSLVLHALVIGAFIFGTSKVLVPKIAEKIEIQVTESNQNGSGQKQQRKFSIRNLFKNLTTSSSQPTSQVQNTSVTEIESPFLEPGRSMEIQKSLETESFLSSLRIKINEGLQYPTDLADQRIEGQVTIVAYLNHDGTLTGNIKTWGSSPILETFTLASVMEILKNPLPEYLWNKKGKSKVKMHFTFETYTIANSGVNAHSYSEVMGDRLIFHKNRQVEGKVNLALKKFFTRTIPPIIPIPGGVMIDFFLLYDYIKNIGTMDPDNLRKLRVDQLREQLEQSKVRQK